MARAQAAPVGLVPRVRVPPVLVARRVAAARGPALVPDRDLATTHSARTRPAWARPLAANVQSVKTGRRVVTALSVATVAIAASVATASQASVATVARVRVSPARRALAPVVPVAVVLAAPARMVAPVA